MQKHLHRQFFKAPKIGLQRSIGAHTGLSKKNLPGVTLFSTHVTSKSRSLPHMVKPLSRSAAPLTCTQRRKIQTTAFPPSSPRLRSSLSGQNILVTRPNNIRAKRSCANLVEPPKIKLITFDFLGTLAQVKGAHPGKFYSQIGIKHGVFPCPTPENTPKLEATLREAFFRNYKKAQEISTNFGLEIGQTSQEFWRAIVLETFRDAMKELELEKEVGPEFCAEKWVEKFDPCFEEIFSRFKTREFYKLYPDTKLILQHLKNRNLTLGVISNTDERLHGVLGDLGLSHFFDFVLVSREAGCLKPDKKIFDLVLEKFPALRPQNCMHIGDDPEIDFEGAKKAGWHSLLVCREDQKFEKITLEQQEYAIPDLMPLHANYGSTGSATPLEGDLD